MMNGPPPPKQTAFELYGGPLDGARVAVQGEPPRSIDVPSSNVRLMDPVEYRGRATYVVMPRRPTSKERWGYEWWNR